jgi:hypothetical protein
VVLASEPVGEEHVIRRSEVSAILPESASVAPRQARANTHQRDVAICVETFKDEIRAGLVELRRGDLKGGFERPVRLLDPWSHQLASGVSSSHTRWTQESCLCSPRSRDSTTTYRRPRCPALIRSADRTHHSHCTSHSLSPLNGSGILPCFRSSTCTEVGNDAHVVHSSLTSDQVGEDTWEKDQWELMGVLLGMVRLGRRSERSGLASGEEGEERWMLRLAVGKHYIASEVVNHLVVVRVEEGGPV